MTASDGIHDSDVTDDSMRTCVSFQPGEERTATPAPVPRVVAWLVAGADDAAPQVVVTDIRMPPTFQQEGIEAAKEVRKRHPGTGVVVLSQYDDPEYASSLLREGSAGYAYLLNDRLPDGDQSKSSQDSASSSSGWASIRRLMPGAGSCPPRAQA